MFKILLLSGCAGIIGTGLGGLIGLIFGSKSRSTVSCLLSLAAGVMLSIAFFDLIPQAMELTSSLFTVVMSIICGVICVGVLNIAIDIISGNKKVHENPEGLHHQDKLISSYGRQSMLRSGILMFSAIALHNLPEGMAIGSSSVHSVSMGLTLTALIAIHDIPEGISIAVPFIEGGMNRLNAVFLTALSGTPTIIGGLLGALIGSGGNTFAAISLAAAAGAMIYVTFCEIFPQAVLLNRSRVPALFSIFGILFGLIMVTLL